MNSDTQYTDITTAFFTVSVTRFHRTHVEVIKFMTITKAQPPSAYFMQLTNAQQISYTELHTCRRKQVQNGKSKGKSSPSTRLRHAEEDVQCQSFSIPKLDGGMQLASRPGRYIPSSPVPKEKKAPRWASQPVGTFLQNRKMYSRPGTSNP